MAKPDDIFDATVEAAVTSGRANFDSLVRQLRASGMSEQAIVRRMLDDLENEGPIFGQFLRGLGAAAQRSAVASQRQGTSIGEIAVNPKLRREAIERFGLDVERAETTPDPDLAFDIEESVAELRELMWVCSLVNTCHACLPLHGIVRTAEEWAESGDHPDTIHALNGITIGNTGQPAPDYCVLVDTEVAASDRDKVLAPLKRVKVPTKKGERLNRRTVREVASKSLETSEAARDKLQETLEGRRALRKLGQASDA